MHLHPSFNVSLLNRCVHDNQSSRIRPAPIPDLFADGHEEWEASYIGSHRWWASHLHYLFSWGELAEDEKVGFLSLIWPILSPSWSPSIGFLQAVLALRYRARENAASQP
jgi:hypothetical protein